MSDYPKIIFKGSENTGGHCMVDFILFDNHTYLSIDNVSAVLHSYPEEFTTFSDLYSYWFEHSEHSLFHIDHYDQNPAYNDIDPDYDTVKGMHWVSNIVNNLITVEGRSAFYVYDSHISLVDFLEIETRIPYFDITKVSESYCDNWIERLYENNMAYHFDDDPYTVGVSTNDGKWLLSFTRLECKQLERIVAYFGTLEGYDPFEKLVSLTT